MTSASRGLGRCQQAHWNCSGVNCAVEEEFVGEDLRSVLCWVRSTLSPKREDGLWCWDISLLQVPDSQGVVECTFHIAQSSLCLRVIWGRNSHLNTRIWRYPPISTVTGERKEAKHVLMRKRFTLQLLSVILRILFSSLVNYTAKRRAFSA